MRKLLIRWFQQPVLRLANRFSSRPDRARIYAALTELYTEIVSGERKKGLVIPFDSSTGKFIIFSDQHKGGRNGADDFLNCETNYLAALDHYYQNGFHLVVAGDCEELWENTLHAVRKGHAAAFEKEKQFIPKNAFIKIFGNHDLYWENDPFAPFVLRQIYDDEVPVYEGVVLETEIQGQKVRIFCTHGHQGDKVSDGNWFSKWFVSRVWGPVQSFLKINPNTPAYDASLKTEHNAIMYEWSSEQDHLFLITGHTHQPVFESLTHIERLYRQLLFARQVHHDKMIHTIQNEIRARNFSLEDISPNYLSLVPTYFNTGCCCFSDGDITGIEIEHSCIRLVKWHAKKGTPNRTVLEEASFAELLRCFRKEA